MLYCFLLLSEFLYVRSNVDLDLDVDIYHLDLDLD